MQPKLALKGHSTAYTFLLDVSPVGSPDCVMAVWDALIVLKLA